MTKSRKSKTKLSGCPKCGEAIVKISGLPRCCSCGYHPQRINEYDQPREYIRGGRMARPTTQDDPNPQSFRPPYRLKDH